MRSTPSDEGRNSNENKKTTPLPWKQLSLYLGVRLAEPISATIIFPFIPRLIDELHIASGEAVGYYVGIVESLFFVTQAIFVIQWGRLSDRIGRKPVLMSGLLGVAISSLCFGLSKTFTTVMLSRAMLGALNGNGGVIRSALGELADESNIGRIYSFLPLSWWSGATLGPLIGGFFAHPADRFPMIFASQFWKDNPYFLPCLVAALLALASCWFGCLFLEETHPILRHSKQRWWFHRSEGQIALESTEDEEEDLSLHPTPSKPRAPHLRPLPFRSLLTSRVKLTLLIYGFLALLEIAIMALLPIFFATTLKFSVSQTGLVLGTLGFINGVTQTVFFVPVQKRIGTKNVIALAFGAIGFVYALFPLIGASFRRTGELGTEGTLLLLLLISLQPFVAMGFTSVFLYIRASSPAIHAVGSINGIAQSVGSISRAVGPATGASLFAYSAQHPEILNGGLVWCVLGATSLVALMASRRLPLEPWERECEVASILERYTDDHDD